MVRVSGMGGCTPEMDNPVHWEVAYCGRHSPEHREQKLAHSWAFQERWREVTAKAKIRQRAFATLPTEQRAREGRVLDAWVAWQMRMWARERAGASCP